MKGSLRPLTVEVDETRRENGRVRPADLLEVGSSRRDRQDHVGTFNNVLQRRVRVTVVSGRVRKKEA